VKRLKSSLKNFFDKNSLWNELNIQKRELYIKKEKITGYGMFSQAILGRRGQRAFEVG
jgi:hypothetical protein